MPYGHYIFTETYGRDAMPLVFSPTGSDVILPLPSGFVSRILRITRFHG
jgi:hypothetical protein